MSTDTEVQITTHANIGSGDDVTGTTVAAPILLHGSTPRPPGPAPGLGEHSRTLLAEAGYSDAQIDHLLRCGVVQ